MVVFSRALQENPHMLDVVDMGFLVHNGSTILVDAGGRTWLGGAALGRLWAAPPRRLHARKKSDSFLVPHLHFRSRRRPATTQYGNLVFPNAGHVAKAEIDFWFVAQGNRF